MGMVPLHEGHFLLHVPPSSPIAPIDFIAVLAGESFVAISHVTFSIILHQIEPVFPLHVLP